MLSDKRVKKHGKCRDNCSVAVTVMYFFPIYIGYFSTFPKQFLEVFFCVCVVLENAGSVFTKVNAQRFEIQ